GFPPDRDRFLEIKWTCIDLLRTVIVRVGERKRAWFYPVASDHLSGASITSLIPDKACPGDVLTVNGSGFGVRGNPLELVMPFDVPGGPRVARIVDVDPAKWTDTSIEAVVPAWARSGPVGFLDLAALEIWRAYSTQLGETFEAFWTDETTRAPGLGCGRIVHGAVYRDIPEPVVPLPDPTEANLFWGTAPEIALIGIEGEDHVVEPGAFVLRWRVVNARSLKIRRREPFTGGGDGWPSVDLAFQPTEYVFEGSVTLDLDQGRDGNLVFEITAGNGCSTTHRRLVV